MLGVVKHNADTGKEEYNSRLRHILSELTVQAFISPKYVLNQTRILYVTPNYTTIPSEKRNCCSTIERSYEDSKSCINDWCVIEKTPESIGLVFLNTMTIYVRQWKYLQICGTQHT